MSQIPQIVIAPMRAEEIKPAWLRQVRDILVRDGQAARAGRTLVIEIQAINTGTWHPLDLPANTVYFETAADRDQVLAMLVGAAPIP